jgi:hypothetical protein
MERSRFDPLQASTSRQHRCGRLARTLTCIELAVKGAVSRLPRSGVSICPLSRRDGVGSGRAFLDPEEVLWSVSR